MIYLGIYIGITITLVFIAFYFWDSDDIWYSCSNVLWGVFWPLMVVIRMFCSIYETITGKEIA